MPQSSTLWLVGIRVYLYGCSLRVGIPKAVEQLPHQRCRPPFLAPKHLDVRRQMNRKVHINKYARPCSRSLYKLAAQRCLGRRSNDSLDA